MTDIAMGALNRGWTFGFATGLVDPARRRLAERYRRWLRDLVRDGHGLVEAGEVTPVVGKTYPLVEAADAIRELERGHATGKIVVTV